MKKRITALTLSVLQLLLSVLLLSACSEKGGNTEETDAAAAAGGDSAVTAVEEETAWIDTLPEVDYGGYTFNMAWSTPNMSWNEMAPDADEIAGDLVGEAVHQRNLLTEDRLNISIAHDISKLYKIKHSDMWQSCTKSGQAIVYARVRDALISKYVKETYKDRCPPFLTFGSMEDIYDRYLLGNKLWQAAVCLNGLYNEVEKPKEVEIKWREAKSFDRESSFAASFHQRNLLRLVGYEIVEKDDVTADEVSGCDWDAVLDDMKSNYGDSFNRIEHLRWMAFHFVRGVECWLPQKSELEKLAVVGDVKRKVKPNMLLKSDERYVHAALREFEDLPQVDALFESVNQANGQTPDAPLQKKDSDLTKGFEALRKAGFSIRRVV